MKSTLRSLLIAAAIGAMALASAAVESVKSFGHDLGEALSDAGEGFLRASGLVLSLVTFTDAYTGKFPLLMLPPRSDVLEVVVPFTMPAANVANNDVLGLCRVPANARIVDWAIFIDGCDTNGTPTLAYSFGSLNSPTAPTGLTTTYKAGITAGRTAAGGVQRADTVTAQTEQFAAERQLGLLFTAAAATYVAGKTGLLLLKLSDT